MRLTPAVPPKPELLIGLAEDVADRLVVIRDDDSAKTMISTPITCHHAEKALISAVILTSNMLIKRRREHEPRE